jgi:hypothetical protein
MMKNNIELGKRRSKTNPMIVWEEITRKPWLQPHISTARKIKTLKS